MSMLDTHSLSCVARPAGSGDAPGVSANQFTFWKENCRRWSWRRISNPVTGEDSWLEGL